MDTISLTSLNFRLCCVCQENAVECISVVKINCEHTDQFCNHCILQWLQQNGTCPICRKVWKEKLHVNAQTVHLSTSSERRLSLISSESLSTSSDHSRTQTANVPIAYFGILYPQQLHSERQQHYTRKQIWYSLGCYIIAFIIVILVYTILIIISKKFERKT